MQPLVISKGQKKISFKHFSLGHCQGLKDIKDWGESQLPNVRDPGQNENAGPLVQKAEKSVIRGTEM